MLCSRKYCLRMMAVLCFVLGVPFAQGTAKAQETPRATIATLPWSENFENYSSSTLGSEWATPATYGGKPCVLTNNSWASPAGSNSLECRTNSSNSNVFVFPQFDKPLNTLTVQFKIGGHTSGRGQFGYVTNASSASSFVSLTDIAQPSTVGSGTSGYTQYNYDLSTMSAPISSSYRLAVKYTFVGSGEDSWYFDDFSVTYTAPSYPLTIASVADWNAFCQAVNGGHSYSGETVTMTADVSGVTTMAGVVTGERTREKPFSGTFDGGGHTLTVSLTNGTASSGWYYTAPFRYINGATIKDLKVTGTINISCKGAAGVAGHTYGTNTIQNCVSDVTIESTQSGDGTHGGFVSMNDSNSTLSIRGCAFTGKLRGSSTNMCGGFVGYTNGTSNLYDCVFAPQQVTISNSGCSTFSRNTVNCYNCYYTETLGTDQGKLRYTVTGGTGVTVALNGATTSHNLSHITGYNTNTTGKGIAYDGTIWAGSGDNVSLTLSGSSTGYQADHGTLTVSGNPYTLGMTANNTIISAIQIPAATLPYTEDFENGQNGWEFVNGTRTNKWYYGAAGAHTGSKGLFISNNGTANEYTITSASAVWAYKEINFDETKDYIFSFDWRANGESCCDYLRAGLVPASTTLVDGTDFNTPTGWIDLNEGNKMNVQSTWQTKTTTINVTAGTYKLAFCWKNDGSVGTNPPAAIDNIDVHARPVYTITTTANPQAGGTVSGGGQFYDGTSVTVTASANSNYCFVNWTENGTEVSRDQIYRFTATGNRSLYANFVSMDENSITVSGTSVACGNSTTLTASGLTGVTYNWYSDAACTNLVATGSSFTTPMLYNNTTYYVKAVKQGGIIEQESVFQYTGSAQTYPIPANAISLKMEVWGAQGGGQQVDGNTNGGVGGKGGYSVGTLENLSGVSSISVYVGGQGGTSSSAAASGGWNGGGTAYASSSSDPACGGGGATDIRVNGSSLYYRIIVAGGGGGGGEDSEQGGYGGGTTGGTGSSSSTTGGTQTGGGTGYALGIGASTQYDGGAGGGGWYGGGCGGGTQTIPTSNSTSDSNGGCGGSGYVWTSATASSAPSGYNVSSSYYLTDAQTIAGNATIPNPNGGTMTGREGDGYARITAYVTEECESAAVAVTVTVNSTMTYDVNGGSGTMTDPNSPYNNGSTVTVLANSFTRTGYVFNCWNTAANGSGTKYVAGDTFTITANTTLYAQWAPLVIANTTQWNEFAAAVNSGFNYSGLTVTMTDNVGTVTTIVGMSGELSFQGTFDGQCHTLTINYTSTAARCAPFHTVKNATFQNLKIAGTINTSHIQTAGLIGYVNNNCAITNCVSDVTIVSTYNSHGGRDAGFIGQTDSQAHVTFTGCAFTGRLLGASTSGCAGFVGFNYSYYRPWSSSGSATVSFTDCIFAPAEVTMGVGSGTDMNVKSATFARSFASSSSSQDSSEGLTFNNCYYTQSFGTVQGTQCYTITPGSNTTVALTGNSTGHNYAASCSGTGLVFYDNEDANSTFDNGFSYNNGSTTTLYAAGNVTTNLLLGATTPANSTFFYYSATPGSLSGNAATGTNDPYTLTMTAANQSITANYVNQTTSTDWTYFVDAIGDVPSGGITISSGNVTIGNREGLAWVISMVNALNGVTAEDAETFAGLTYTLTADVDMSAHTWVPIGTVEHPFSGTFNGNGHVIKGITRSTDFPHDGLFGYVSGSANIQNVVVQASLTGNSHATGAVVGTFASTGTISNVEGAGTLTGGTLTTALGGIAGNNSGTLHSSFGVATMTGGASATQMGGLVGNNTGNLYNSYSNATYAGTSATKGGLVGSNSGTVENCYAAGIASGVSAFAGSNSGTIQYCYTDAVGSGYIGTSSTAPTGSGTYGAVQSSTKHLDYMYRDNLITANTNTYVGGSGVTSYVGNHIPVWNGLVSALNQWVRANPHSLTGLAPWYRPISSHINGDLPVLGFAMDNSLGTLDSDGKFLQYGSNQNGGNGLDVVLTTFNNNTASIFHYGKATGVANVPTSNVKVSIAEDAVLLQGNGAGAFTATVGVTFDNSDHGQHAYDFWGNKLNYDWHLLSTPLSNLKTGAVHSTYQASGDPHSAVDITSIGGYFPANLITPGNPAIGGAIKWDFYTYYEPEYHWINLKRNKNNHYHQDSPNGLITYSEADQDVNGTSAEYIPGKGYEMAISQDTYMNATGTLNRGNVSITLTNQEPGNINYAKGWNLVGNPYQAYLDIDAIGYDPIYTYDADQGLYVPYTKTASANPAIVSQYIHPHQAFFVRTATDNVTLRFQQSMATTTSAPESYFRDKVNYPLVNLFAEDETGHRDLTVIEFHRPELGGAAKLDYMRTAPFSLAAHYSGKSYGILFATDDIERVPVHFKPAADGLITLSWSTHNGEFSLMKLVDNKLGVEHNMLADNSYSFMTSADDYSSRFYITYECSGMGVEENDEGGASTGSATFAYINNGNIVVDVGAGHGASLQVIDVLGRVLYSQEGLEGACTVSTSGLAKGVYILRLSSNQGIKTQKIVVQ